MQLVEKKDDTKFDSHNEDAGVKVVGTWASGISSMSVVMKVSVEVAPPLTLYFVQVHVSHLALHIVGTLRGVCL